MFIYNMIHTTMKMAMNMNMTMTMATIVKKGGLAGGHGHDAQG